MKKVVLIDGNNLLFRSFFATAYNGNLMRNSKGFPTNGLYGFVNMINKRSFLFSFILFFYGNVLITFV